VEKLNAARKEKERRSVHNRCEYWGGRHDRWRYN
jgi:hypothetical protein